MSNAALRAVAKTDGKPNHIVAFRDFLTSRKSEIAAALPRHLTPDRMIRLALTEFTKNKTLQACTPASVYGGIIQASQLGLEIGVMGQAYLVPYRNNKTGKTEAQFIPGYKGLIALARRSGDVTSIETHIVYEHDVFELELGIETKVRHVPNLDGDRGRARLVYGVAHFKDGGHHFEWMTLAEVERVRARSKASTSGPWVTDYEQMVRKTLIRRMSNYLPMSIELSNALQIDQMADDGKAAVIDGAGMVVEKPETEMAPVDAPPVDDPLDAEQSAGLDAAMSASSEVEKPEVRADNGAPTVSYAQLMDMINRAQTLDDLAVAGDLIQYLPADQQEDVSNAYGRRYTQLKRED